VREDADRLLEFEMDPFLIHGNHARFYPSHERVWRSRHLKLVSDETGIAGSTLSKLQEIETPM